jgi:hypothetical protein
MALNPRSSRNGSANTSSETGGIFHGKITLVYPDNTLRVFVKTLGINVGPCRVIGKEYNEQFQTNDEVLVAYLDNQKSEMIVIGRLTERLGAEAATTEPIGHEDKTESIISFVNATRIFTIAPVGDSFHVWCVGRRYTKTAAESITLPDTTGLYYIYYSATGVLSYKTSYFTWDQDAPTAYIYYNSATAEAEFFADERHGVTLDWATHEYLHRTRGASLAEGLGASGYTLAGTGSSNADIQISIENGTFFDEDLEVNITHSATPTANTWEQRLQSPAYIPMFYRFGSSGSWRLDTATAYPVKYGSARATYNLSSGGTWSTPDMTSGKFGVTWIVATNNLNEPVIGILGQTVSDNIGQAEDVSYADLDLTGLPIVEIRPLYKLIYETNTGYTNAVKSRLASIADIRANQAINIGIGAGALSSLTDVGLTTTVANDILAYNGSNWTNTNTPTFQSVTIIGGVTVDTSTFSVDAINNRVGILTTSPNEALDVRGNIALTGSVIFEGSTADGFETILTVVDPTTADRTLTLPNVDGTVITTGNLSSITATGTVTSGTWSGSFGAVSGANLTSLNASNLASGTVASARISGSYTGITGVGTLSAGSIPSSLLTGQTGMWTSAGRPGATRLYRNDYDDGYNVQTYYNNTNARWRLYGYFNSTAHAGVEVAYSDSAGSASTATTATNQSGGTVSATYLTVTGGEWLRTSGGGGWYNTTYARGINCVADDGYIKTYPSNGSSTSFSANYVYVNGRLYGPGSNSHPTIQMREGNGASWSWTGTYTMYVDVTAVKTFVIDHPIKQDNYLVHACAEGPTSDVFYRGTGQLQNGVTVIELPDYFESLTEEEGRTVMITPIADEMGNAANLAAHEIYEGKFIVELAAGYVIKNQRFWWRVDAVRKNTSFAVEPEKSSVTVSGDGPYTYIQRT